MGAHVKSIGVGNMMIFKFRENFKRIAAKPMLRENFCENIPIHVKSSKTNAEVNSDFVTQTNRVWLTIDNLNAYLCIRSSTYLMYSIYF